MWITLGGELCMHSDTPYPMEHRPVFHSDRGAFKAGQSDEIRA